MTARVRHRIGTAIRRVTLAAMAAAHFVLSAGVPLPVATSSAKKPTDRAYPCMDRPCGCQTYEQCWAGDCCCFTMAEKLAWAKRNSVTPPASALKDPPPDELECPNCVAKKSCCATPSAPEKSADTRWVVGLFVQKCRGEAFAGVGLLPVAVAPEPPFVPTLEIAEIFTLPLIDHVPTARATPPDAPPPKHV